MTIRFITAVRSGLSRFSSLCASRCTLLVWPVTALLLALAGWILLLTYLDNRQRELESSALEHARALARSHAGQLERSIDTVDQILRHVKFNWELSDGALRLDAMARRGLFPPASDFNIRIVDRNGKVVSATGPSARHPDVTEEADFILHRNSPLDFLHVNGAGGVGIVLFSRKLPAKNGVFAGVVVASVASDNFSENYDERTLGRNGLLAMMGVDGAIGAARIGPYFAKGASPAMSAAPHVARKDGSMLLGGHPWFSDGRARYIGWQTLDAHPVIALVGLDQQDVLTPYRQFRITSIRYAGLITIMLFLAAGVAAAFSARGAERRRQLELTQAAYRMATDEGVEGFYIFKPAYGRDGEVADFKAIDCNSRGAELLGVHATDVIGRHLSAMPSGTLIGQLSRSLHAAMEAGAHEDELEASADGQEENRWMHVRIVGSNGNLAVRLADISDRKAHMAELERRSYEDALTGLPNRHWVNVYLPEAIARANEGQTMLALLFIDLDGFKSVNDSMGHEAGDELLRHAGRRLKLAVRPGDHVARIGGDEFVVIIESIAQASDAALVAERVVNAFHTAFRLPQGMQSVGTSIGVSVFPCDGTDADTLLRNADIAMYSVKTAGKRNYRFFDAKFYEIVCSRMERERELRQAVDTDEFVIHYQPRVDISTGMTSSMEALVRWQHPRHGLIGPQVFIPIAEETGVILPLGALVIDKVCTQLANWAKAGHELVPVSINVSPRQFNEVNIAAILQNTLVRHGVSPSLIELELTESIMMGDHADITAALTAIQQMGVKLLVDDFGTGYSSLSQLHRLDFDVLKVDQAFTARLEKTEEGSVFFKAIITMAHALGMRVVAEGVETMGQVRILKALQCDEIQGYFISQPLPPAESQPVLPKWFLTSTV